MNRRQFLQRAAALAAGVHMGRTARASAQAGTPGGRRPPNIVLIVADDLGYGDLACYGHPQNQTPHLDRLCREGVTFTDYHANGPMCSPTRAALLTGQYQHRFGKPFERALSAKRPEIGLPPSTMTIPQALKQAGYATGMYGKWHLGYQAPNLPANFGFDDFRGLLTGDGDHISHISRSGEKDWYHNEQIKMEEGYSTELITEHSVDFMQRHQDQPFFLYVAHLAIHFPWQAPGEAAHRKEGQDYWSLEKLGPHPEGEVKPVVKKMVEAVDKSVGDIMAALRGLGLDDNTLVFFTSDNGGYLEYADMFHGEISRNAPCRGQKCEVWEGGHRVPAIGWWPGRIEAGSVTDETAMTMDMFPTFAELAGVAAPDKADGVSLAPLLFSGASLPSRDLFWRIGEEAAVRRGPWKLVIREGEVKLFNLDKDIGETNDVSAENRELVKELLASLEKWDWDVAGRQAAGG